MTTDYHHFTTKATPLKERRRMDVGDIWINAVRCHSCGETIRSKNRHDFVTCRCKSWSVDGGSWYRRMAGENFALKNDPDKGFTDLTEMFDDQP